MKKKRIAKTLLEIDAVGFRPDNPIIFKSGMSSPIYVDNRKLPFHPSFWHIIIEGFRELIIQKNLEFDVIAGIETAGIPHSTALAYSLQKPSVFVRKKIKDHGTKSRVEGGSVKGKKVLLVEDLVTTGGSSLAGVEALRQEGATVENCIIIVTYGFTESKKAFADAQVKLHPLTTFSSILDEAESGGKFSSDQRKSIESWFANPHSWGAKYA